ncbi:MAG: pimB, partial [Nocardioides sp.]|nr:pimB [Nocardioides sp.]
DHHRRVEVVRDVAVMRLRRSGLRPHTLFLKRLVDVVLTTVALVVLSPVLLACAVAVRIETGPGVIFRQTRVGIGGRNFTLFKFRSLKPATALESATEWNIDLDDRLGPVGRFLRRTSLDELPQLVNVLRGDMSLVGPRPERPFFVREFSQNRHRYHDRHRVQTGLTGWAQVNDLRGDTSIDDRVRFDNYYIENWSLWGDVKIMFRTVAALGRPQPAARALALAGAPAPAALSAAIPPRVRRGSARTPVPMVPASLRVVHVSMPTSEGVAEVAMAYVRDQVARGWDVTVVCPSTGRLGYAAREAGARVVWWQAGRNPGPGTLRETVRLRRILAEAKPDLVHLHSAKAGLAGRLVLRGRIPTIFQPHAWSFLAATGLLRVLSTWWERLAGRWTTELVCVSDSELRAGQRAGIRASCATVVPNGVEVGALRAVGRSEREAARRALGLPDLPTVVCVGRLAPQKGQLDLLDAWPRVRAAVPAAQLVLVGDGPDRGLLEARIEPGSGVTLVGARTDVPTWLTAANVVTAPSRWEGMALSPLEAMASARSLVATDVVGIEGSVPPSAGVLVAPGHATELADALVARLADPELADAEGRQGRAHVAANFDASGSVDTMAAVSLRLAGTRTRSLATAG